MQGSTNGVVRGQGMQAQAVTNLYCSAHFESFLASLMYLSGIARGSLLLANRKPTGAAAENVLGVCPNRCQNVLLEGSLPLQSIVPNLTLDVTDMRFEAPTKPSPSVVFSLAHSTIHGSPPKNTCIDTDDA